MPQLAERTRPKKPGRWRWKERLWKLERLWRDLVPLIALGLAFYAVTGVESKVERQKEARQVTRDIICAFGNGFANAGRAVILGPTTGRRPPTRFERELMRLGYPPRSVRRAQARDAARRYAEAISRSVVEKTGGDDGLVRRDGTLDCEKLGRLAERAAR